MVGWGGGTEVVGWGGGAEVPSTWSPASSVPMVPAGGSVKVHCFRRK